MVCIRGPVPSLFTHVLHLWSANLQRVPLLPSSDINIWANAVRQLLVEKPQQSLAVTTWECSSEGNALPCDYKQQRESGGTAKPRLSCCLACVSDAFFCCATNFLTFFYLFFFQINCEASSCGRRRHLQPHFDHDRRRRSPFHSIHAP